MKTPLVSVEEVFERITTCVKRQAPPVAEEEQPLQEAMGRILAAPLKAHCSQPACDLSAMDGFAVRAEDVRAPPVSLHVLGESRAGMPFSGVLGAREAVRISTGAPLPEGADTVIIQEHVTWEETTVNIHTGAPLGKHVRRTGLDFREGERYLKAGVRLSPAHLCLAAAMNLTSVPTRAAPTVTLLACGDELVPPGTPTLQPHHIIAANAFGLRALFEKGGAQVTDQGIAKDDLSDLCRHIDAAQGTLLVTIGGASVGPHDFMQEALLKSGYEIDFWRVAMRPGKPLMFGSRGEQFVLGLPGNPVSALVCARLFGLFFLEIVLDVAHPSTTGATALLGCDLPPNDERQDYLRAYRDENNRVVPFKQQDSFMMTTLAQADCLLMRPPHAPAAQKGDRVSILDLWTF